MTTDERRQLLAIARRALEARVRGYAAPPVADEVPVRAAGVFVTIHCDGALRGCLGTLDERTPLAASVARLGADVATEDFRFPRVTVAELPRVTIDLSVLTPPERVTNPENIEVGRDGLIVEQGNRRGLLLPQVATEHGWDRETLLEQTCVKAGLPATAWQHGATVRKFQAEVFAEENGVT